MTGSNLVTIVAAVLALAAAIYTANSGRKSAEKAAKTAAEAADREGERQYQIEFVQTLSQEVDKLNARISDLRIRLTAAEDTVDAERAKRREVESHVESLTDTVERLTELLSRIPAAYEDPRVRRILDRQQQRSSSS